MRSKNAVKNGNLNGIIEALYTSLKRFGSFQWVRFIKK